MIEQINNAINLHVPHIHALNAGLNHVIINSKHGLEYQRFSDINELCH